MTFGSFSARIWSEKRVWLGTQCAGSLALKIQNTSKVPSMTAA